MSEQGSVTLVNLLVWQWAKHSLAVGVSWWIVSPHQILSAFYISCYISIQYTRLLRNQRPPSPSANRLVAMSTVQLFRAKTRWQDSWVTQEETSARNRRSREKIWNRVKGFSSSSWFKLPEQLTRLSVPLGLVAIWYSEPKMPYFFAVL